MYIWALNQRLKINTAKKSTWEKTIRFVGLNSEKQDGTTTIEERTSFHPMRNGQQVISITSPTTVTASNVMSDLRSESCPIEASYFKMTAPHIDDSLRGQARTIGMELVSLANEHSRAQNEMDEKFIFPFLGSDSVISYLMTSKASNEAATKKRLEEKYKAQETPEFRALQARIDTIEDQVCRLTKEALDRVDHEASIIRVFLGKAK